MRGGGELGWACGQPVVSPEVAGVFGLGMVGCVRNAKGG